MTKDEVLNLENRLYSAIKESNIQELDELLHQDLLFINPYGNVITKEVDLNTYREGNLIIHELTPDIENLNIIDNLAVITLVIQLKGNYKGEPFGAKFRYIRFWKEFTEGIKVVGGSAIQIEA
ncbi:nuclear transport factor 2 family protein [Sphingobacterium spiritivorum]|uniref:nuclear transport factor 2 family protein n=1 Tax=Sphingobacterium TaxID=28453 RepID=UPI0025D5F716|nr:MULTISPECIES: nuclear transport factor 2 family protein [unclassified Sphingobacterium]